MPSTTSTTQGPLKSASSEINPENMDHLVQEIRENLKLGVAAAAAASAEFAELSAQAHREKTGSGPGAGYKLKSSFHHRRGVHRSSPYAVPPSSRACDTTLSSSPKGASGVSSTVSQLRKWNHQRRRYPSTCMNTEKASEQDPEDPFQMLQELITDGSLIKEAVKRLQKGLYVAHSSSNKTFYDSEDDETSRTPPPIPLCSACEVGL
eukprot:06404.XXX_66150_66770_1 [CDS] Oithona nana genome sequencing.